MLTYAEWSVFLGATIVYAVTPGPGMLYVLARSLDGGRREGALSALGNAIGDVPHVSAGAVGLSTFFATSPVAFTVVKLVGATYLGFLGVRVIGNRRGTRDEAGVPERLRERTRSPFVQGMIVELLNPKTALFFLALLPQFVHPEGGAPPLVMVVLGLVAVATAMAADLAVAFAAGPVGERLSGRSRMRERQRAASGGLLIGLATFMAVT